MTKQLSERYCAYAHEQHGLNVAVMRYACFVPCDFKAMGLGRWGSFVEVRDAASATYLAVEAMADGRVKHETFNVQPAVPFTRDDWPALVDDPTSVFERYYPGSTELLAKHDLTVPKIEYLYDITRARETLGYNPQHNLEQFFETLRQG